MANQETVQIGFVSDNTAKINQMVPLRLFYSINRDVNITEDQIPFVNSAIFVKDYPEIDIVGSFAYTPYIYGDNYYRIKGDSTLVYQGFSPFRTKFSQPEITAGNLLSDHTSKWYFGTIAWTDGTDNYEIRDGNVLTIICYYDIVNAGLSNPNLYNFKSFQTSVFDLISGTTITGQGTRIEYTMEEISPGNFQQNVVETRLVNETVTLEEDVTLVVARGFKYKNNVFQNFTGELGFTIKTGGFLNDEGIAPSPHGGGIDDITSFSYEHETTLDNDGEDQLVYRLYSSSRREKEFFLSGTYQLTSLPDKSDDLNPSDSLFHTQYTVEVNPGDYPLVELDNTVNYSHSDNIETWTKVNDNKFIFFTQGTIILQSPANSQTTTSVDFVNETYSHDGDHYSRNAENRDDKQVVVYTPIIPGAELKLILSTIPNVEQLNNPKVELRKRNGTI